MNFSTSLSLDECDDVYGNKVASVLEYLNVHASDREPTPRQMEIIDKFLRTI